MDKRTNIQMKRWTDRSLHINVYKEKDRQKDREKDSEKDRGTDRQQD